jgi:uncharacterized protein YlxW (UPF0749 family)
MEQYNNIDTESQEISLDINSLDNLEAKTAVELTHLTKQLQYKHESLKNDITRLTTIIDDYSIIINKKLEELESIEKTYIEIIRLLK